LHTERGLLIPEGNMKKYIAGPNDANQRLDKFIQKTVKGLPPALLYKYVRLKRIKVNGKRAAADYRLAQGDVLELYIGDEFFCESAKKSFLSAPARISVVYEDENIILVDKKPGLVVHEDDRGSADTLIKRVLRYLYEKGEYDPEKENSFTPALCNRLDRNTGGIVIAAKNAEALRMVNGKIKSREIKKYYLCIVHGRLKKKTGILEGYLKKNSAENKVYISSAPVSGGLAIKTGYRVLDEAGDLSLLEVELITGRTHQIRAHMASIGHTLLGDGKYGTNAENRPYGVKWQALYSYKVDFDFKTDAGILGYLKGKTFQTKDIWFVKEFFAKAEKYI
jgi:23S rRNA pseudouridine955/2504/2580 synthase